MSQNNSMMTVLSLARRDKAPDLTSIVRMIKNYGFYRKDKFGELVFVPPDAIDPDDLKLRDLLLDELADGFKGGDYDPDYYQDSEKNHSFMAVCGWDFVGLAEFNAALNKLEGGSGAGCGEAKVPAPQSYFYTIFINTLLTQVSKEVIDKIVAEGEKSDQTALLVKKLGLAELGITPKLFQRHLRDAMGHYNTQIDKLNKMHHNAPKG